jgi:hypothetical protein
MHGKGGGRSGKMNEEARSQTGKGQTKLDRIFYGQLNKE